ncbi:unnamed protein product [Orchesella dallaii]|uniref:Uncharacterized protein n=1 Tax=Orchesella dallaii TaxID=48710 RepID=A0ABP1RGP2_9HEXA
MTTENESNDFPRDIQQTLSRMDFDVLLSDTFVGKLMYIGNKFPFSRQLFKFYLSILRRSYFTVFMEGEDFETSALQNATHGKEVHAYSVNFSSIYDNSTTLSNAVGFAFGSGPIRKSLKLDRFVLICEDGCMDGPAFFGQTRFIRKRFRERPILRYYKFWYQREPSFESFRFAKFLSGFVKSGLYDLEVNRYNKLKKTKSLKWLESSTKGGWSNGSLFSYAFLDASVKEKVEREIVEKPMKIVALNGTLMLAGILVLVAVVTFLIEFRNFYGFSK